MDTAGPDTPAIPAAEQGTDSDAIAETGPADAPADGPVGVDAHVARVVAGVRPLPDFPLPLMDALGMAVAEDVIAEVALPAFDVATIDGYAVRREDVADASSEYPVDLPVVGEITAGRAHHLALSPGTAVSILAGAPVPTGADSVVPFEWTDRGVARVTIRRASAVGQHVRRAGADVAVGDVVLQRGTVVGPRHLGLLASLGRAQVRSRPRPRVVVLSTGSALREPGQALAHGAVHDGNSYLLAAAAKAVGATAYRVGIVPDDVRQFSEALSDQLVRADLVIVSGGVSTGEYDVVREALGAAGTAGSVRFDEVALRPGARQGFGHVGEDEIPIFCLPGNPVAAYASFQTFVLPALRTMMGMEPVERPTRRARLTHPISSVAGVREFVRATYGTDRGGAFVTPVGEPGADLVGDLAQANAFVVVDEDTAALTAGDVVRVQVLDEDF